MRHLILAVIASAAIVGCSADSIVGSQRPLSLTVTTDQPSAAGQRSTSGGVSRYACPVRITAAAEGGQSGEFAGWGDGEIDFRLSADGSTQALFLGPTDLQDWFGADRVKPAEVKHAAQLLQLSGSGVGPFTATIVLRYALFTADNPYGEEHSATLFFTCQ